MNRHARIITVAFAFALIGQVYANANELFSTDSSLSKKQNKNTEREVYSTQVVIEYEGKVEASCMAYGSMKGNSQQLSCRSSVSLSNGRLWRISVQADISGEDHSNIYVDIDDLDLARNNSEGEVVVVEIFKTSIRSKGPGTYSLGVVQGRTVKIEIAKAEQGASSNP
jgi:hypothetical protein